MTHTYGPTCHAWRYRQNPPPMSQEEQRRFSSLLYLAMEDRILAAEATAKVRTLLKERAQCLA